MSLRTIALRYKRVSSEEQRRDGLSLPMQDSVTLKYALAHPEWLPGKVYEDVLKGTRDDRPGYQALLAEVRRLRAAGQPCVVIVWKLDRFGRRLLERVRSWEELLQLECDIHSVMEGGKVNRVVAKMLAVIAEEEVLQSGERIKGVLDEAKANGWFPNGTVPFGYRGRPRTSDEKARGAPARVLDRDPLRAAFVEEGFKRLADKESANSVHRWLAALSDDERGGRVMHIRAVRLMFQSTVYMGKFEDGTIGQWPALIDENTWHKAQQAFRPRGATGREASVHYVLSGFLVCPDCGRPMHGMRAPASAARKYAQARYRCNASSYGEACRFSATVGTIDAAVIDQVGGVLDAFAEPEYRERLERAWALERTPRVVSNTERTRRQLEREIKRADQDIADAVRSLGREKITQAAYDALYRDASAKQEAARKRLAELEPVKLTEPDLPPIDELLGPSTSWRAELAGGEMEAQRRVLALLVERVVARRVAWGQYEVSIDWTPLGRRLMLPSPVTGEQVS